jgi:hypothetical protein
VGWKKFAEARLKKSPGWKKSLGGKLPMARRQPSLSRNTNGRLFQPVALQMCIE